MSKIVLHVSAWKWNKRAPLVKTFLTWIVQLVLIKNVRLAINLIVDRVATLMDTFKSGSIPTLLSGKNMHFTHLLG